jgi:hypothetical protein
MQNKPNNPFYDFRYGQYLLRDLFDINIQDDDYLERAYNIYREINNVATGIHLCKFTIDDDCKVPMPCNLEYIEAVSSEISDGDNVIVYEAPNWNDNVSYTLMSDIIKYRVRNTFNKDTLQLNPKGDFISYELRGTPGSYHLEFNEADKGREVYCIYRGIFMDHENNPLLHRKEAEAIAYKLALLDTQKKAFKGDNSAMQLLQMIETKSGIKMAAAKIAEHMTQNEIDQLLRAKTTHNRKVFWSSYKMIN